MLDELGGPSLNLSSSGMQLVAAAIPRYNTILVFALKISDIPHKRRGVHPSLGHLHIVRFSLSIFFFNWVKNAIYYREMCF